MPDINPTADLSGDSSTATVQNPTVGFALSASLSGDSFVFMPGQPFLAVGLAANLESVASSVSNIQPYVAIPIYANLSGEGDLTADASLSELTVDMVGESDLTAEFTGTFLLFSDLQGDTDLLADFDVGPPASPEVDFEATLSGDGSLTNNWTIRYVVSATLSGSASCSADEPLTAPTFSANLAGNSNLSAASTNFYLLFATLAGDANLSGTIKPKPPAVPTFESTGELATFVTALGPSRTPAEHAPTFSFSSIKPRQT